MVLRITISVALGFVMTMSILPGCSGTRHKDRFQWAEFIKDVTEYKAAHETEPVYFDVPRIMPFEWEEFYVFPPYTTVEAIEEAIGFGWGKAKDTGISERDDITLLLFVAWGGVLEYIEQPRAEGDFSRLQPARAYSTNGAFFEVIVEERDGQPWFYFVEADRPR